METTLSIPQIICVSQLQNKQLEKVLCSRAYRTVNGQKWAQFSPHGEISPVLTETHPCMELQPQVTSMGSLPLPTGGNVSVCSLHPSTALPPHFLWLYLLMQDGGGSQPDFWGSLVSSSPSFATSFGSLSGPADGSVGTHSPDKNRRPVPCLCSLRPLTFTGGCDGTVVPFQVGGRDRVEGVERQAVRAVHGAGQAVLEV